MTPAGSGNVPISIRRTNLTSTAIPTERMKAFFATLHCLASNDLVPWRLKAFAHRYPAFRSAHGGSSVFVVEISVIALIDMSSRSSTAAPLSAGFVVILTCSYAGIRSADESGLRTIACLVCEPTSWTPFCRLCIPSSTAHTAKVRGCRDCLPGAITSRPDWHSTGLFAKVRVHPDVARILCIAPLIRITGALGKPMDCRNSSS